MLGAVSRGCATPNTAVTGRKNRQTNAQSNRQDIVAFGRNKTGLAICSLTCCVHACNSVAMSSTTCSLCVAAPLGCTSITTTADKPCCRVVCGLLPVVLLSLCLLFVCLLSVVCVAVVSCPFVLVSFVRVAVVCCQLSVVCCLSLHVCCLISVCCQTVQLHCLVAN